MRLLFLEFRQALLTEVQSPGPKLQGLVESWARKPAVSFLPQAFEQRNSGVSFGLWLVEKLAEVVTEGRTGGGSSMGTSEGREECVESSPLSLSSLFSITFHLLLGLQEARAHFPSGELARGFCASERNLGQLSRHGLSHSSETKFTNSW